MQRVSIKGMEQRDSALCGSGPSTQCLAGDKHEHREEEKVKNSDSITIVSDFDTERARREADE
jgi:hypothetical protein